MPGATAASTGIPWTQKKDEVARSLTGIAGWAASRALARIVKPTEILGMPLTASSRAKNKHTVYLDGVTSSWWINPHMPAVWQ